MYIIKFYWYIGKKLKIVFHITQLEYSFHKKNIDTSKDDREHLKESCCILREWLYRGSVFWIQ